MQTSHLKTYKKKFHQKAFALIEIMVVLGLLALAVSLFLPKMGTSKHEVRSVIRHVISLTKNLKSLAKLHNLSYRIVFDLKNEEDSSEESQEYWVEKGNRRTLDKFYEQKETEKKEEEKEVFLKNSFIKETKIIKRVKKLPQGLKIDFIHYALDEKKIESRKAYLYFLPQGYTQEALIQFSFKEENFWTIYIHPLTGQAYLFDEKKTLKEIQKR